MIRPDSTLLRDPRVIGVALAGMLAGFLASARSEGPALLLSNIAAGTALAILAIVAFSLVRPRLRGHPRLQMTLTFLLMPLIVIAVGWVLLAGVPTPVSLEGAWIWPGLLLLTATGAAAAAED